MASTVAGRAADPEPDDRFNRDIGVRSKKMASIVADPPQDAAGLSQEVSVEEASAILDRQARRYIGISGEEFLRRWNCGYWPHPDRVPGVIRVSMLLSRPAA